MSAENPCPHCGKPVPINTLGGICPECMLKAGLLETETGEGPVGKKGTSAPIPEEIAPLFPQLELLEFLGRGGMGAVYKARQPKLGRFVALKVLAREKESDPKFAERFTREAQALARLNHPNIVTVYDFGEVAGLCYLLMEFVDGKNLRELLQSHKLSPDQALTIVPKLCEALQFAHEQGVVHRDVKPENILLDKQGRVKIADFGIAKMVGGAGGRTNLTDDKQVMGTPHYMAPEQVEKPQEVDHRADIYSLGVVFYEMLTGELPLGKFQPPSRKVRVDVRLDEVVLHALEKEPERRYQRADDIKTDVEAITSGRRGAAADQSSNESRKVLNLRFPLAVSIVLALLFFGIWVWLHQTNRMQARAAPIIMSFTPPSGAPGTRVSIPGSNFNPVPASNIVYFGAVRAAVTLASPTNLIVTVPLGAIFAPISETVNGLTAHSEASFLTTFAGCSPLGSTSLGNSFNLAGGKGPFALVIADLDGDGKPDLIFDNDYDATIWIYRNIGSNGNLSMGSFAPPVILQGASVVGDGADNLADLAVVDLDGDGRLDIVVANSYRNVVSVFQNLSSPGVLTPNSFGARIDYVVGSRPVSVAVGDLDADGKPDIIAANIGGGALSILRNISRGNLLTSNSFAAAVSLATPGKQSKVVARDMDGDGKVDLITANYSTTNDALSLFRNTSTPGRISFAPRVDLAAPAANEEALVVEDIDGDGKPDLIAGSYLSANFTVYRNIGERGSITTGSFAAPVTFAAGAGIQRDGIALADIDGDGKPDIAIVGQYSGSVYLYRNLSTPGSFTSSSLATPMTFVSGNNSVTAAIGDLDGDGRPDIAIANAFGNNLTVWKNVVPMAGAIQPPCTLPSDAVAWWRGEGGADDVIEGNDGVFNGTPSYTPGEVGLAFNFNGSSYVQVPDGPGLHFTNQMSVDAWVNLNRYTGRATDILVKHDAPTFHANSYALSIEGAATHRAYFAVVDTNFNATQLYSITPIPTNQWVHIAGTYDGSTMRIYINGAFSASAVQPSGIFQGNQPLTIGAGLNGGPDSLFDGQIDEVTLYKRALSGSEIAAIYNAGSAGKRLVKEQ